ncbi:MAG: hypothetical protein QXH60_01725 [Candidatus Pacearchaeota archaeon]
MKNKIILLFILFSLWVFSLFINDVNVYSLEIQSPEQTIGVNIDNFPKNEDEAKDVAKDFLYKKWDNFLVNTPAGRALSVFENIMKNFDLIFNLLLGVVFSWSFTFFITLSIWIFLVSFLYRILSFLGVYLRYKVINLILLIISIFVISFIGISNILSYYIISSIQSVDNIIIQIILSIAFIFAMIFLSIVHSKLKRIVSSLKNAKDKKNLEKKEKRNEKELKKVENEILDIKRGEIREKKKRSDEDIKAKIEAEIRSTFEGIGDSEK